MNKWTALIILSIIVTSWCGVIIGLIMLIASNEPLWMRDPWFPIFVHSFIGVMFSTLVFFLLSDEDEKHPNVKSREVK